MVGGVAWWEVWHGGRCGMVGGVAWREVCAPMKVACLVRGEELGLELGSRARVVVDVEAARLLGDKLAA